MKPRNTYFTLLLLLLSPVLIYCQQRYIDSLQPLLKTDKEDTTKVIHLYTLCSEYQNIGNYDTALYYGNAALQLAQQLNYKKGIAASYGNIGIIYANQGNYPKALENFFADLKIQQGIGVKQSIAISYNNIGSIYRDIECMTDWAI